MARGLIAGSVLVVVTFVGTASAQQPDQGRLQGLEERVTSLEAELNDVASAGGVVFLFGAFCALWAQGSGRSAWLWFFLGVVFQRDYSARVAGKELGRQKSYSLDGARLVAYTAVFFGNAALEGCDSALLNGVVGLKSCVTDTSGGTPICEFLGSYTSDWRSWCRGEGRAWGAECAREA